MPFFREASSHSATRVTSEACRGKEGGFDYFSVAVENDWHTQVRTSAGSRGSQATPSALRRKLFFGICTNANSRGGYERVRTNEVLQAPQPLSMHSVQSWVHCEGKPALGMAFIRPRTNLDVRVEVRNDHRLTLLRQRLLPTLKADEPVCQRRVHGTALIARPACKMHTW